MSDKISVRNGLPTKASVYRVCEKHNLIHHHIQAVYKDRQTLTYGGRFGADAAAKAVAAEFEAHGFNVEQSDYNKEFCRNGSIVFKATK